MLSRVNTYNFHSNVKEIKKILVNQLFRQRVMASMIFTHSDNSKFLSDHVNFRLVIRPNNANTLLCMDTNNTPYRHPTQKSMEFVYIILVISI
jgi:hypothetical protein